MFRYLTMVIIMTIIEVQRGRKKENHEDSSGISLIITAASKT